MFGADQLPAGIPLARANERWGRSGAKSEETFMRSLIILSIVVLLKIEQELSRALVKRAVPRRRS